MLFVGDDWAEDHHDIEVQDEDGRRLARARLPEGIAGLSRLHELIAEYLTDDDVDPETGFVAQRVMLGIETDRGIWVSALVAAGYQVFPLNPVQVARYRERHGASGAKSDRGDAHVLAEIVRLDRTHHRAMAGDSPEVEGLKLVARSHQAFIWDRTRHFQRLRSALREFFPAALEAFPELLAPEALELLERAPDPARAARLSRSKITAALNRAHRRDPQTRAEAPVRPSQTTMRTSSTPRALSSFITRSQNFPPSVASTQIPRTSFLPSVSTPTASCAALLRT